MADYYNFRLKAGQDMTVNIGGKLVVVDSIGAANGVDITPVRNSSTLRTMPGRRKGFKAWIDFDSLVLRTDVDADVALFLSFNDVSLGFTEGAQVNVAGGVNITNGADQRIPVDIANANVNVNAVNVGINNTEAAPVPVKVPAGATLATKSYQAQALANVAPVAVTQNATALVAADAARRGLRLRNAGANAVALVAAGGTFAAAAVVLQPGETWNEPEAPGAAWYGICDAGLASTINIQTVS